jgi:CCR4-NOT transcription complex subunit 1
VLIELFFCRLAPNATLVQTLVQLGPEITSELEVTRGILARFDISETQPPDDDQVADIITQLARLATEGSLSCDVGTLVHALSSMVS